MNTFLFKNNLNFKEYDSDISFILNVCEIYTFLYNYEYFGIKKRELLRTYLDLFSNPILLK